MERVANEVTRGSLLEPDRCHRGPIPPFVGGIVYRWSPGHTSGKIVDVQNWIGSPTRFPLNLSFVFVAYFVLAHLWGGNIDLS